MIKPQGVSVHLSLAEGKFSNATPVSIQFHENMKGYPDINAENGVIDANVTKLEGTALESLKTKFDITQQGGSLEKGGKSRKSRKMRRRRRKRGKKTQHKR